MTSGRISRRSILKTGGALALSTLAMPAIVRQARASSGSVNFIGWGGFDYTPIADKFKADTGITLNVLSLQPDQETLITQAKLAMQTGGVDIVEPPITPSGVARRRLRGEQDDVGKIACGPPGGEDRACSFAGKS